MSTIRIEQEHHDTEFEGRQIAKVATPNFPRWVEMTLYSLDTGGYVLHRIGQSMVYHAAGGVCGDGESASRTAGCARITVDDLPDDAEPCKFCEPPAPVDLPTRLPVLFEQPRHTIDRCADPATVIKRITRARHRGSGITSSVISRPVKDLLTQAMVNDEGFAHAPKPVEKIG
jgi:hypothetical protein